MDILISNFEDFRSFISEGGLFFMVPLLVLNAFLWYGLGYRYLVLKRGSSASLSSLITKMSIDKESTPKGIIDSAIQRAIHVCENHKDGLDWRIDEILYGYLMEVNKFKGLVGVIVLVAPLIGLLGTVDGMIEMFQSLVDGQLFSQNGGIAAGVSKALCTTEMGLIIAVPGIILHHNLNNKGKKLEDEIFQIKFLMLSKYQELSKIGSETSGHKE